MKPAFLQTETNTENRKASSIRPLTINFAPMKKIIFILALSGFYLSPLFSQSDRTWQGNGLLKSFPVPKVQKVPSFHYTSDLNALLKGTLNDPNLTFLQLPDKTCKLDAFLPEAGVNLKSPDRMPCLKPQGNFPMRIYTPDPTLGYSLRIKKY